MSNMTFKIEYHEKVKKDIQKLKFNKSQLIKLKKKIEDVAHNPFPKSDGGLGERLNGSLKGYLKFRFDNNYRVIYQLFISQDTIKIVIIGLRSDSKVYRELNQRNLYE